MKHFSLVLVAYFFLSITTHAQQPDAVSADLNQQVAKLYQQGRFDEAISIAKKLVDRERKASKTSETYALSLFNLGTLYKQKLSAELELPQPNGPRETSPADVIANDAEGNFRRSIEVLTAIDNKELTVASIQNELAWVLSNHMVPRSDPRKRIDEAEKLYAESLATRETAAGKESQETLSSLLASGHFYLRWINFEKALPFYERYISTVESKEGKKSRQLIPALRAMAEIFSLTFQDKEASETVSRISEISGKPASMPVSYPRLALRARKLGRMQTETSSFRILAINVQNAPPFVWDRPDTIFLSAKRYAVAIVVNEQGDVIEAKALDKSGSRISEMEAAAMSSKFRPFSYNGTARKMRGVLNYVY